MNEEVAVRLENKLECALERVLDLEAEIVKLKRVNKEWETLWKSIDELVRPITPLGKCVGKEVLSILEMYI